MAGFIVLSDGRAYSAANWAYDATVEAIAKVLPHTGEGRALAGWLLDQRCSVQGAGLGSVDLREFHDSARAIQFIRSKAKEWNIDPKRIAATGRSAGAGRPLVKLPKS